MIGGFKLVINGTSRQGEFNALHDPGDFICNPLLLDSGGIIRDNPVAEKLLMTDLAR